MNNDRRKMIGLIKDRVDELVSGMTADVMAAHEALVSEVEAKWGEFVEKYGALKEAAEELVSEIESVLDEEQEFYDNMPESFQNGEKGEAAQTAIDALESAINSLQELPDLDDLQVPDVELGAIEEASASLDEAAGG